MSLIKNIGIGKGIYSFFKYIPYKPYIERDELNDIQSRYEELGLLPNEEEIMHFISGQLLFPSKKYEIYLISSWKRSIEVHLTYYGITGNIHESRLMQIDPGIHIGGENEKPRIIFDASLLDYAKRLADMNVGYKFRSTDKLTLFYEP